MQYNFSIYNKIFNIIRYLKKKLIFKFIIINNYQAVASITLNLIKSMNYCNK